MSYTKPCPECGEEEVPETFAGACSACVAEGQTKEELAQLRADLARALEGLEIASKARNRAEVRATRAENLITELEADALRQVEAVRGLAEQAGKRCREAQADLARVTAELAEARAGWKATALELDGYEGGVPTRGSRLWRAEHELAKARARAEQAEQERDARQAVCDRLEALLLALPKCTIEGCGYTARWENNRYFTCDAHRGPGQSELQYAEALRALSPKEPA